MSFIDIKVQNNDGKLRICIKNNGRTVPIEFDEKEKLYVPELIFGHLMTGSNFDDTTVSHDLICFLLFSYLLLFLGSGDWWDAWIWGETDQHLQQFI
jgi:hypothetical protein